MRDRLGQEGGLGWPRGRGPVGRGGVASWKKVVAAGPKDQMGRLAAGPIGTKVKEKLFSE
jgi:hypothetical protein